ncbi:hypothetical protein JB92DRAFT_2838051 [Gautieria morchelliformis]|nr:hypothetical protein JB92DRAFT_2838051 [Gautieria morchelliformis]
MPIHSYGHGRSHNPTSLWYMSSHALGTYMFVHDWYDLWDCLRRCLGQTMRGERCIDTEEGKCDCDDGEGAARGGVDTYLHFASFVPPASALFTAKERRNPHSGHSLACKVESVELGGERGVLEEWVNFVRQCR